MKTSQNGAGPVGGFEVGSNDLRCRQKKGMKLDARHGA